MKSLCLAAWSAALTLTHASPTPDPNPQLVIPFQSGPGSPPASVEIAGIEYIAEWVPPSFYDFRNIRYALPPTGDRRFARPVAVDSNTKMPANDTWFSRVCPQAALEDWECKKQSIASVDGATGQPVYDMEKLQECRRRMREKWAGMPQMEDCLFLDVNVPAAVWERDRGRCVGVSAPVVVIFDGGSFVRGSKFLNTEPYARASAMADKPAPDQVRSSCGSEFQITVSANYRLGMFGWLTNDADAANVGLWDQRLALEWVQANIERFGGDPSRVTVMGSGAAAASIMHHITAFDGGLNPHPSPYHPSGTTPFSSAIIMGPDCPFTLDINATYRAVMIAASQATGQFVLTMDHLRSIDEDMLKAVNYNVTAAAPSGLTMFGPVVGGEFVRRHPAVALRDGLFNNTIKLIVGYGSSDGTHAAPVAFTSRDVDTQMSFLLHGFSNATLQVIEKELYNNRVRDDLVALQRPPDVTNLGVDESIAQRMLPGVNMAREIFMGCNIRNLARALPNTTYVYSSDISPVDGVTGVYSSVKGLERAQGYDFQERFLRFIHTGVPDGTWLKYGEEGMVWEVTRGSVGSLMGRDPFKNGRCEWWTREGYETFQAEAGQWFGKRGDD